MKISKKESVYINQLRFICMVFLLLLHTRYDSKIIGSEVVDDLIKIEDLISIPFLDILFFISGYLFFVSKEASATIREWIKNVYPIKIKKRIYSLLIPYVVWCIASIIYNALIKETPLPNNAINWIMQFWDAGSGQPVGMAMWYVKSLIIFSVLSPIYWLIIKYFKHFILIIVFFLSAFEIPIDFPYFNIYLLLGAYLALSNFSIENVASKLEWKICIITFFILMFWHYFDSSFVANALIRTIVFTFGIWGLISKQIISPKLTVASSAIYFMHPYFTGIRNTFVCYIDKNSLVQCVCLWFITAFCVLSLTIFLFYLLKRLSPQILKILIGDRF